MQLFWKFELCILSVLIQVNIFFLSLCLIKPLECGSENGFFSFIKTFGSRDFRQILELGLV